MLLQYMEEPRSCADVVKYRILCIR